MPYNNGWPYTDVHQLNLDWIVKEVKEVKDRTDEIDQAVTDSKNYAEAAQESAENASQSASDAHDDLLTIQGDISDWNDDVIGIKNQISTNTQNIAVDSARIDAIISGTTPDANAELIDIRVGADGTTYPTAGDAVRGQITDLKSQLNNVSDTVYVTPVWFPMGLDGVDKLVENNTASAWYIPMIAGAKYHLTMSGIANASRVRIFVTNNITDGSTYALLETSNAAGYEDLTYIYENSSNYKYLWVQTAASTPNTTVSKFTVKQIVSDNSVRVGSKTIHRPNRETVDVIDSIYSAGNDKVQTYSNGSGYVIACEPNTDYKITVKGTHNRFYIYGVSNPYIKAEVAATSIWNSGDNTSRDNDETTTVNSGSYDFLIVSVRFGQVTKPNIVAYKMLDSTYKIDDVPLFVIGETDIDIPYKEFKYKDEFTADDTVSLISTYVGVIALYDALVTAHPAFVTKNALNSADAGTVIYEYVFSFGDYNATVGYRSSDSAYPKPKILITAGIHGDEQSAVMATYVFCKALCEDYSLRKLKEQCEIHVVPIACPYGYDNNTRLNANGVNINRNFDADWELTAVGNDYSGPSAASEYETHTLQSWIGANDDAVIYIDHHNSGYNNEVGYWGLSNYVTSDLAKELKHCYWNGVSPVFPYWQNIRGVALTNIYSYTGTFNVRGSAIRYGTLVEGIPSVILETSWNQYGTGKDSKQTIGISAEVMANALIGLFDYCNSVL